MCLGEESEEWGGGREDAVWNTGRMNEWERITGWNESVLLYSPLLSLPLFLFFFFLVVAFSLLFFFLFLFLPSPISPFFGWWISRYLFSFASWIWFSFGGVNLAFTPVLAFSS